MFCIDESQVFDLMRWELLVYGDCISVVDVVNE